MKPRPSDPKPPPPFGPPTNRRLPDHVEPVFPGEETWHAVKPGIEVNDKGQYHTVPPNGPLP